MYIVVFALVGALMGVGVNHLFGDPLPITAAAIGGAIGMIVGGVAYGSSRRSK